MVAKCHITLHFAIFLYAVSFYGTHSVSNEFRREQQVVSHFSRDFITFFGIYFIHPYVINIIIQSSVPLHLLCEVFYNKWGCNVTVMKLYHVITYNTHVDAACALFQCHRHSFIHTVSISYHITTIIISC